jgi:hypothetical protein
MQQNVPDIELVRQLAMTLPRVVEGNLHGAPSWKVGGKLLACAAIHRSAEANSLVVKVSPAPHRRRPWYILCDRALSQSADRPGAPGKDYPRIPASPPHTVLAFRQR